MEMEDKAVVKCDKLEHGDELQHAPEYIRKPRELEEMDQEEIDAPCDKDGPKDDEGDNRDVERHTPAVHIIHSLQVKRIEDKYENKEKRRYAQRVNQLCL